MKLSAHLVSIVIAVALSCIGLACGGSHPAPQASPAPSVMVAATSNSPPAPTNTGVPATPNDDMSRLRAIVSAADRSDEDRALDVGRHPAELLGFAGIHDGMRVGEIGAWKGYTAELLARAVGDSGRVYAQDPRAFGKYTQDAWTARAKNAKVMARITRLERDFEDPLPAEAHDLDAVFIVLFYHDTVWLKTDRAKMNRAIFAALKSGGEYIIVDHRAKDGDGTNDAKTFHRIEESAVRAEVEQAGFKLTEAADFLKNPADTRDWDDSDEAPKEKRGTSDRFVLKYMKP